MATELDLDDVAAQSDKAKRELKELRDTLTAVSDALDYLHGMTPKQAADVRKDAERYRWLASQGVCIPAWEEDGAALWRTGKNLDRKTDEAMQANVNSASA